MTAVLSAGRTNKEQSYLVLCSTAAFSLPIDLPQQEIQGKREGKVERNLLRSVHKVYACRLLLRVCQDLGSAKNRSGMICCESTTRFFKSERSEHKTFPQTWLRSWLGTLLAGELGQGGKVKARSYYSCGRKPNQNSSQDYMNDDSCACSLHGCVYLGIIKMSQLISSAVLQQKFHFRVKCTSAGASSKMQVLKQKSQASTATEECLGNINWNIHY